MIWSFVVFLTRSRIPIQSQPLKSINNRLFHFISRPTQVSIFNPEQISSLLLLRQQPTIKSSPHATDMKISCRRWCKTCYKHVFSIGKNKGLLIANLLSIVFILLTISTSFFILEILLTFNDIYIYYRCLKGIRR